MSYGFQWQESNRNQYLNGRRGTMIYKYEMEKEDYSDFASGRVLHNAPNTTAFPVRLGKEIMSRCLTQLRTDKNLILYDPCCGGAHLLTFIGFLYREHFAEIYGSDIDEQVLEYAKRNLNLLTEEGLLARKEQLQRDFDLYQKESHLHALKSVERLERLNQTAVKQLQCFPFHIAGVTRPPIQNVNIVFTDLPYGNIVDWKGSKDNHIQQMLTNIYQILDLNNSIVAIVCDKKQKVIHGDFEKIHTFHHGRRKITFLKPFT
jgi:tRNA G10  N-methylase Trm11